MNQQEQNTASTRQVAQGYAETKAFILEMIDDNIKRLWRWQSCPVTLERNKIRAKELKIRRQEVVEMLEGVEDE